MKRSARTGEPAAVDFDLAIPRAAALIESLRGFGYTPRTAIADLFDNSIAAQARNVWFTATWDGSASYIALRDDGHGMDEEELIEAMRPGSRSPMEERDPRDLGRFGLGLKTASFSQCRRLTVRTRKGRRAATTRCWDLDYVVESGEWRLLRTISPETEERLRSLEGAGSGTIVLWENLDRIVGDAALRDEAAHDRFRQMVVDTRDHLGMVFHRFLSGVKRLKLHVNDRPVQAWDPFLSAAAATQDLGEETLHYRGQPVVVRPYVLPHHSKIDGPTHSRAAGPQGWNAQQGFYVYRNKRLLVAGDWLGLPFTKEEHYKLARIRIDLPNSLDRDWQIDVRKSRARPPGALRDDLRRIATLTRERAVSVYRHRGKVISRSASAEFVHTWERLVKHGKVAYRINREHPLVKDLLSRGSEYKQEILALLRLVEETVPVPLVALDHAEQPHAQAKPFDGARVAEVRKVMGEIYQALRRGGLAHKAACERLRYMEPFSEYSALIDDIEEDEGMEFGR